ncbi:hypothetical protein M758_UG130500 [Ceratodon purpureus]|nr:hypothetical protein M758_UG130500 [Ceratodon purpureus]
MDACVHKNSSLVFRWCMSFELPSINPPLKAVNFSFAYLSGLREDTAEGHSSCPHNPRHIRVFATAFHIPFSLTLHHNNLHNGVSYMIPRVIHNPLSPGRRRRK